MHTDAEQTKLGLAMLLLGHPISSKIAEIAHARGQRVPPRYVPSQPASQPGLLKFSVLIFFNKPPPKSPPNKQAAALAGRWLNEMGETLAATYAEPPWEA